MSVIAVNNKTYRNLEYYIILMLYIIIFILFLIVQFFMLFIHFLCTLCMTHDKSAWQRSVMSMDLGTLLS